MSDIHDSTQIKVLIFFDELQPVGILIQADVPFVTLALGTSGIHLLAVVRKWHDYPHDGKEHLKSALTTLRKTSVKRKPALTVLFTFLVVCLHPFVFSLDP